MHTTPGRQVPWHDLVLMSDTLPSASGSTPDRRLLDCLGVPALALDEAGVVTGCNVRAAAVLAGGATSVVGVVGRPLGRDPGAVREVLAQVLDGQSWSGDLDLGLGPEPGRPVATFWSPLRAAGDVSGAVVVLEGGPTEPAPSMGTARLGKLADVMTDVLVAEDLEQVTDLVTRHVTDAAGATIGTLSTLVDPETLALVGIRGGLEGAASRWATYPVAGNTPAAEAFRTRSPLLLVGRAEIERRYPGLESAAVGDRSLLCLPLNVSTRTIGVITLSFPGVREIDPAEQLFLRLVADTCAQAIDRLAAQQRAVDREDKLRFLAEASARLASELDHQATLTSVAELAVPWFADWCAIALVQDDRLHTLSVAHAQPDQAELVARLQAEYPASPDAERGAYQVLRSGRSDLIPEVTDELLVASAQDEEHLSMLRSLSFRSALSVPLTSRGRVLGVITWVTGEHGRRFSEDDRSFGEDLALRAATALDNADLHSQLRDSALRLQEAVLPDRLPAVPGWDLAVRYLPAGRSGAGGDFYDVLPLDGDRIAFFVGDVMGRGVEATSVMAQMRSAVRTLVAVDPDPAAVMRGLDRVFERWTLEQLVTVLYGVADRARGVVEVINAGHPFPLLLDADGRVRVVAHRRDAHPRRRRGPPRRGHRAPGARATLLLAYTDGLVERRGESYDDGVARLERALAGLHGRHDPSLDLAARLAALVDEVRDPTRDDDVAALVLLRG